MARAPLLQLTDLSLTFGGTPVFEDLDLVVQPGERIALVGRNGSGKSTLLKVMGGLIEPDRGAVVTSPGTTVGYMEQEPAMEGCETLGDYAVGSLDPAEAWRVDAAAEGLKFDPARPVAHASGGERRRAALARLMAEAPQLMLIDEPTNHLDIEALAWLEAQLQETRAAFITISHDRAFLRALTRTTLWIDRGQVRRQDRGFAHFEDWRDKVWEDEDQQRHKMDRRIKAEGRWAVEGISARRKRNQGRVRALQDLRAERSEMIRRQGTAAMALEEGPKSGRKVIEATGISKRFDTGPIVEDFDLTVQRGDRIAFVGPNGVGKTTLLKLLLGQETPDEGTVRHGTNLEIAVFDQARAQLDPDATLWNALTGDPEMRVSGQADQVMVRGTPRHVVGYLKDFLFDEAQVRAPVRSLSGGERARLLLARLMARSSNLLVLDEPTNDLDIETLDLLQDLLGDYDGTVLLVSHDRDFLDRVASTTIWMEGAGRATVYAGGWSDATAQRGSTRFADAAAPSAAGQAASGGAAARKDGAGRTGAKTGAQKTGAQKTGAQKTGAQKTGGGKGGASGAPGTQAAGSPGAGGSAGRPDSSDKAGGGPAPGALSFTERHRLDALPEQIARLEGEIGKLETLLADPDLFTREPVKFRKATEALSERQARLSAAEEDWLDLAARAEAAGEAG